MRICIAQRIKHLSLILGSFALLAIPQSHCAARAGEPQSHVSDIRQQFQAEIDRASKRWGVAIVAEGGPIIHIVTTASSHPSLHETVDSDIASISEAFDYSVTRKGSVFLLRKKFTDPRDMPDLTMGEAYSALNDLARILAPFDPHEGQATGRTPASIRLAQELDRDQLIALNNGGMKISELSDQQRADAWVMTIAMLFGETFEKTRDDVFFLGCALDHNPDIHWGTDSSGGKLFGYDIEAVQHPVQGDPLTINFLKPLSRPDLVIVTRTGTTSEATRLLPDGQPDLTDVTEPTAITREFMLNSMAGDRVQNLAKLVERLKVRLPEKTAACRVDPELALKGLMFSGLENAPPVSVATAAADIYGLDARNLDGGGVAIARPVVPAPGGLRDVRAAMIRVIPGSVVRCARGRAESGRVLAADASGYLKRHSHDLFYASQDINYEAKRQVRSIAEPLSQAGPDGRIRLSKLPVEVLKVLAVSESIDALVDALSVCDKGPQPWSDDFDHARLSGSYAHDAGQTRISLQISVATGKSGATSTSPGVQSVILPTPR